MISFNKACTIGTLFRGILILKPLPFLLMVQLKFHLLFNTLAKSFTSSRENPSVDKMIDPWLLIKEPSSDSQKAKDKGVSNSLIFKGIIFLPHG